MIRNISQLLDYSVSSKRRSVVVILLVALAARSAVLIPRCLAFLGGQLSEGEAFGGNDVPGWLAVAEHFVTVGDLSLPMLGSRPPLFPMSVALVFKLGGDATHAAFLQAVFGSLTAAVGYLFALRLLREIPGMPSPQHYAFLAGLVLALDPVSIAGSITLLSEPLFNLLFAACLLCLAATIQEQSWKYAALAALWIALAMLTRPTMIAFWLVAPLMLMPFVRQWRFPAAILVAVGATVFLAWSWRNFQYAGVFTYSMQSNFQLLFYRGASAEHLATGAVPEALYDRYTRRLYLSIGDTARATTPPKSGMWEFFAVTDPQLYANMGQMGREILLRYWPYTLLGMGVNFIRLFFASNYFPAWSTPIDLVFHVLLYGLALAGGLSAYRPKCWQLLTLTVVPIVYITLINIGSTTTSLRMGSTMMVPIIVLAVVGHAHLLPVWIADTWDTKRLPS